VSLYLCVFDDGEEIDGVEVGPYADFNALREYVAVELEGGRAGALFPVLMGHSDCDGEWSVDDCKALHNELAEISWEFALWPRLPFPSEWQARAARDAGLEHGSALESFVDVDGRPLIPRLEGLAETAIRHGRPILFQ
jgi:hypothetical protein